VEAAAVAVAAVTGVEGAAAAVVPVGVEEEEGAAGIVAAARVVIGIEPVDRNGPRILHGQPRVFRAGRFYFVRAQPVFAASTMDSKHVFIGPRFQTL